MSSSADSRYGTSPVRRRGGLLAAATAVLLVAAPASAQFGQNKIVYERFDWKVYPSPHFDVHYYGDDLAKIQDVVSYAESAYLKISKDLDHELRVRVPLIVYRNHAEFEQTNVTMSEIPEAVGAFAEPVQNRMVLPLDSPPDALYSLIAHELTHIFQYSLFFEGYLGRAIRSNPPLWLTEGMASYLAQDEDNIDRMVIRDAVVNNIVPSLRDLSGLSFLTYRFGHAIFDFIEKEHGKDGLRNFLFEYRKVLLTNNVDKAVKESFGYETDEFDRRFNRYLRKRYFPVLLEKKAPEDYGKEIGIKKEGVFTFSPTISPSGELIAALATPGLELDLVVLSAEDGSVARNVTRGWTNRYQSLVAEGFAGKRDLSWSPAGDRVAVFARRENARPLLIFDALSGRLERMISLPGLAQCASPAFSPDGKRIAFEANRDGIVDLFELDLETGNTRNVTQDEFFDANPWYSPDGHALLYDRRIGDHWKIFSVDASDPSRKMQLTFGPSSDIEPSYSRDGKTVYFASDRGPNGVFNIAALELATGEVRLYTDVVGGCFSPVEMAERGGEPYLVFTTFFEGTFRLFRMPVRQPEARIRAEEAAAPAEEARPFEPPLNLTLDREKAAPYRLRWDIEAPYVSVGVTDDGTFLSNAALQFTDLLGDHRLTILASSVASYANTEVTYLNLKRRLQWGGAVYDYRDYYVQVAGVGIVGEREQVQRTTGGTFFAQYPLSRNYRVEGSIGYLDRVQDFVSDYTVGGTPVFESVKDRFVLVGASFTGDTSRWPREWLSPFQGKRFNVGVVYGMGIGGDVEGDLLEYHLDFRAYRQLTRRSSLAWRAAAAVSAGDRVSYYSLGGINQLRGYEFRDFFGTRVAWTNLELRFPLVDQLRFPFGAIRSIRGFLFADLGAAWFEEDYWYDPELGYGEFRPRKFKFWDSENDRLMDGRGSYGFGFQFLFLAGLQFNWSWAERLPYSRYLEDGTKVKADAGGRRMDFYIVFDF